MILYEENMLWFGEEKIKIIRCEVWYKGPTGLIPKLDLALSVWKAMGYEDTSFSLLFKAIPVAIGETDVFEEMV